MDPLLQFILALATIVVAAKGSGYLSNRLGQPAVLGELLAGLVLGPTVLNMLHWPMFGDQHLGENLSHLAHLGVLFLMFIVGLEVDLEAMARAGRPAILAIVVLNAILGFTQEYRAERAMVALKKLAVPTVKVRRDRRVQEVSARDLMPGDVVLLEAGAFVPADGRLLESINLRAEEAALTGESEPVEKNLERLDGEGLPLGDRRNIVYMGTAISYGRGVAVITETGMHTELGRIADMIQRVEREPTPLQRRLGQLGRGLAGAALAIVAIVFVWGCCAGRTCG